MFDDAIGLAKNLFTSKESESLIVSLRHYGISLWIFSHQIQRQIPTLLQNQVKELVVFKQNEPVGLRTIWQNFGVGSNFNSFEDFQSKLLSLPKFHFLHFRSENRSFREEFVPVVQDFRLFLHPSDKECGLELVHGNIENYDLSIVERKYNLEDINEDPNPMRRDQEDEEQPTFIQEITPRKEEIDQIEQKAKGRKKTSQTELEELVLEKPERKETKEEMILRHRIVYTFTFLRTYKSPDYYMVIEKIPDFFEADFSKLSLEELKQKYEIYSNLKNMHEIVGSNMAAYDTAEYLSKQGIRYYTGYTGNLPLLENAMQNWRQESILGTIGQSTPFTRFEPSQIQKALSYAAPIVEQFVQVVDHFKRVEGTEKRADELIEESQEQDYLKEANVLL